MTRSQRPWGLTMGVLSASAVTLLGVIRDLDPLRILWRAAVAGVVVGLTVSVTRFVVNSFLKQG